MLGAMGGRTQNPPPGELPLTWFFHTEAEFASSGGGPGHFWQREQHVYKGEEQGVEQRPVASMEKCKRRGRGRLPGPIGHKLVCWMELLGYCPVGGEKNEVGD